MAGRRRRVVRRRWTAVVAASVAALALVGAGVAEAETHTAPAGAAAQPPAHDAAPLDAAARGDGTGGRPSAAALAAAAAAAPVADSASVPITGVYQDTNYNCVPTSSSVSLATFGVSVSQDTLAKAMGTTTAGTYDTTALPVINSYLNPLGYQMWDWTTSSPTVLLNDIALDISTLKRAPKLGVYMQDLPWDAKYTGGHAIVAYGYDKTAGTVTVWDPWKPTGGSHTIAATTLYKAMQSGGLSFVLGNASLADAGDLTGDGVPDLLAISRYDGDLYRYDGTGSTFGGTGRVAVAGTGWTGMTDLTGVGDLTGDGNADTVAVERSTGKLWLYQGPALSGTNRIMIGNGGWNGMRELAGPGDVTGDGIPDLVAVDAAGALWLYPGTRTGLGTRTQIGTGWSKMDKLAGIGDLTGDGHPDLVAVDRSTGILWLYSGPSFGGSTRRQLGTGFNEPRSLVGFPDLTGDGVPDLVAADDYDGQLHVYPGSRTGALGTRTDLGNWD